MITQITEKTSYLPYGMVINSFSNKPFRVKCITSTFQMALRTLSLRRQSGRWQISIKKWVFFLTSCKVNRHKTQLRILRFIASVVLTWRRKVEGFLDRNQKLMESTATCPWPRYAFGELWFGLDLEMVFWRAICTRHGINEWTTLRRSIQPRVKKC